MMFFRISDEECLVYITATSEGNLQNPDNNCVVFELNQSLINLGASIAFATPIADLLTEYKKIFNYLSFLDFLLFFYLQTNNMPAHVKLYQQLLDSYTHVKDNIMSLQDGFSPINRLRELLNWP